MTSERVSHGSFEGLEQDEPFPGVLRWTFDAEGATVTRYDFEPGASFPIHHHPQEQITVVTRGEIEFTADGAAKRMAPGDWSVVRGGVEHGIRAGSDGASIVATIVPRRDPADAYTLAR
jgi:quercetin dioxygenase-like cupin family protein